MEEVLSQPGVEDAPVAGEQEVAKGQLETGVEDAAGEKPADSVPAAGEGVDPKAFAARLSQERERLRRELEAELEPKVRQKLEVELKSRQRQAELAQRMAEVGLDPALLEGYFASHPVIQQVQAVVEELQRQKALQEEVAELSSRFPEVKEIPAEVLELKKKQPHVPLRYLYADWKHDRQAQETAKKLAEEMKARSKETTGPLSSRAPQGKTDIWAMTKQQFAELLARAKRGELKEL